MQAECHVTICTIGQPDAGVKSDDLGPPHQNDVHNDRQSLVLCWRVHVVAVLAHYTHCHILQASNAGVRVCCA